MDQHATELPRDELWQETRPVPVVLLPLGEKRASEEGRLLVVKQVILLDDGEHCEQKINSDGMIRNTIPGDIIFEHRCLELNARSFVLSLNPVPGERHISSDHVDDARGAIEDGVIRNNT